MSAIEAIKAEAEHTIAWLDRKMTQDGVRRTVRIRLQRQLLETRSAYIAKLRRARVLFNRNSIAFEGECGPMFLDRRFKLLASLRALYRGRGHARRYSSGTIIRGGYYDDDGCFHPGLPRLSELRTQLERAKPDEPQYPVKEFRETKDDGSVRSTFAFAIGTKALQQIAADLVTITLPQNEFDFAAAGRGGIHGAATAIAHAIERKGFKHAGTLDVQNAFPSVTDAHVKQLTRLPDDIVCNVLCPPHEVPTYIRGSQPALSATDLCLPQGALSSQPIFSALLGRELQHVAGPNRVIVAIVDDVAILARTRHEVEAASEELAQRLASLSAGPLHIREVELQHPSRYPYVQFCGYTHREFNDGLEYLIRPSNKAMRRLKNNIRASLAGESSRSVALAIAERHYRHWARSFAMWSPDLKSHLQADQLPLEAVEEHFEQLSR